MRFRCKDLLALPLFFRPHFTDLNQIHVMKILTKYVIAFALLASVAGAQVIVLDDFNTGTVSGHAKSGTSWFGQVAQNSTTITIGGSAQNENGWEDTGLSLDLSAMNFIYITGQRDSGHNSATNFVVEFIDSSLAAQQFTVSSTSFLVGSMTVVEIAIGTWTINANEITDWTIGGGTTPTLPFRMTLDNLKVTAAAIPEPSTYAAMAGALALGLAVWRRRSATRA